uniref:Uncharacterized protein n=1 Tax=Arundo donax TaxID=35708 RepID=A0A0A9AQ85_ARUDO
MQTNNNFNLNHNNFNLIVHYHSNHAPKERLQGRRRRLAGGGGEGVGEISARWRRRQWT